MPAVVPLVAGAGRLAMQALPYISAATGFSEGSKEGGLLGGLVGAGAGYGLGRLGMGPLPQLGRQAGSRAAKMAVDQNLLGKTVKIGGEYVQPAKLLGAKGPLDVARGVGGLIPLAAAGLAAPLVGRMAGGLLGGVSGAATGAVGNAGQAGAGIIGYTADGAPVYGGAALPPGLGQYGATSPEGMPLDVLGPSGMGRRLETLKTAQTQRDVLRTLLPEIEAATEARSKKEMERQMAAAGIRQNIKTRAAMQQAAQAAGLEAGLGALQQAGGALTSQYQYQ